LLALSPGEGECQLILFGGKNMKRGRKKRGKREEKKEKREKIRGN
jgi:hypothetical protein